MKIKRSGFTLIELVVVIAIVGMLTSVILAAINGMRVKARDARRVADITIFSKKLEVCSNDGSSYPNAGTNWDFETAEWHEVNSCGPCFGYFSTLLSPCITTPMKDPINVAPLAYYYFYFEPGANNYHGRPITPKCRGHYVLMTHLERPNMANQLCFHQPGLNEYFIILGF